MNLRDDSFHISNTDRAGVLLAQMSARRTTRPRRMVEPGPHVDHMEMILGAASYAPDHDKLQPWRFIHVPANARAALGDAFVNALLEHEPGATAEQFERARDKGYRAPELLLMVVNQSIGSLETSPGEAYVSAGCAAQNMLLVATTLGYASSLMSGTALQSRAMRKLFGLTSAEDAVCFVCFGTAEEPKPARTRHALSRYVSTLLVDGLSMV